MFRYPWGLLPQLGAHIELRQKEAAYRDLDEALAIVWRQNHKKLSLCKLRCAAVTSFCSRGALQAGASSSRVFKIQLELLDKMTAVRSWSEVCLLMRRYVGALLRAIQPVPPGSMEQTVARIREIVRQSVSSPPSLLQHATAFRVSPGHLSRCFSAITGRTFQQETRRIRMEHAVDLLNKTDLKLATIAEEIGFRDTSRFILEFRREFGVTPGEYRRIRHRKFSLNAPAP